jgi:hypothetical protein
MICQENYKVIRLWACEMTLHQPQEKRTAKRKISEYSDSVLEDDGSGLFKNIIPAFTWKD